MQSGFFIPAPMEVLKNRLDSLQLWEAQITLKRNTWLTTAGDLNAAVYLVISGSLRVYIANGTEEHNIRFGYPGEFITPLDSFISNKPTIYNIQAIKKTELKVISRPVIRQFIHSDPQYTILWFELLEQLVYQQMEREIDLLTVSPAIRYQRVLERSPQLFQQIPHKHIASYLRMTPETLSRLKKS